MKERHQEYEQVTGENACRDILIFLETKEKAEFVSGVMKRNGWNVIGTIDEGWSQDQKREVFKQFMLPVQSRPCLIAVKVSAREMENVKASIVLNYDFPDNMGEYEYRLKLKKKAVGSWFSTSKDKKLAENLIKVLLSAKEKVDRSLIQCWLDYEKSLT